MTKPLSVLAEEGKSFGIAGKQWMIGTRPVQVMTAKRYNAHFAQLNIIFNILLIITPVLLGSEMDMQKEVSWYRMEQIYQISR